MMGHGSFGTESPFIPEKSPGSGGKDQHVHLLTYISWFFVVSYQQTWLDRLFSGPMFSLSNYITFVNMKDIDNQSTLYVTKTACLKLSIIYFTQ
jgi:hypothetical protein